MNIKEIKELAQRLKGLTTEADKEAFWAEQSERIRSLAPEQRKKEIEAIGKRVAEIATQVDSGPRAESSDPQSKNNHTADLKAL